jgi:tetratricopeptide (TPR) repeat protein
MTTSLVLLAAFVAQNPVANAPGSPPTPEAITQAVRQLGDEDYHVRERASRWLWGAGSAAEPALRDGLKSTDAEVVARCRDLLDKIPYGITPEMPRRYVELIATARAGGPAAWPEVVPDLLDLGPRGLEVAQKIIERLADGPAQRADMLRAIDREGWRVAPALLAAGQADRAEHLLERSAVAAADQADVTAVRHYAAFLAQRGPLDGPVARWRTLAERNEGKTGEAGRLPDGAPDGRASVLVLLHLARLRGDHAAARWAADRAGRPELREAVLFDQGAWAELAGYTPPDRAQGVVPAGLRAMYQHLAGRDAEAAAALAEVKKLGDSPSYPVVWLSFRALMFARRPDDALALLGKCKDTQAVLPQAEILAQQHRFDEAFKLLERPVGQRVAQRWARDAARARLHHQRGERDKVREILDALAALDRLVPAETAAAQDMVEQLVTLGLTDEALPVAAALLNSDTPPADVFGKLFPKAPLAAEAWWRVLRLQQPVAPMREAVARLPALLDKRLAGPEGKALVEAAARLARAQPPADADRWLRGLGEACQAAGLEDEARRLFEEAADKFGSAAAWLKLGDFHADADRWADAAAAYERAWRQDPKQPLPAWLCGWAKTRAGAADGPARMELAHTLPLGDEDVRAVFAEELLKRAWLGPELGEAARRERRLVLKLVPLFRANPSVERPDRGRNTQGSLSGDPLAFTDRLDAADATQRFLLRMMRTNAYFKRNEGYLIVLNRLYSDRARGLLARGDVEGAVREAAAAHATLPGHTAPAVYLVPELVKLNRTPEAEKVYGAVAGVLDKLCRDHPASALFHNNRAWLAARCRRDLNAALDHARKAVELAPRQAGYRETLAETHFQRGERDQAIESIDQCLELDPKNTYYAKQKRRIEGGDRAAPLPEGR